MSNVHELINNIDEKIATIQRLAELGPAIDDGGPVYFPNCIELLALIAQQSSHLEKLSTQLALCALPRPIRLEGQP